MKGKQMWWLMPAISALSRMQQENCYEFQAILQLCGKSLFPLPPPPPKGNDLLWFRVSQYLTAMGNKGENVHAFQGMTPVTSFPTSGSRSHLLKVPLPPSSNRLGTKMFNSWAFGWHVRSEWPQSSGSWWHCHLSREHMITLFCIALHCLWHFDEFWLVKSINVL